MGYIWRYCTIWDHILRWDIPWNLGLLEALYSVGSSNSGSWNGHWQKWSWNITRTLVVCWQQITRFKPQSFCSGNNWHTIRQWYHGNITCNIMEYAQPNINCGAQGPLWWPISLQHWWVAPPCPLHFRMNSGKPVLWNNTRGFAYVFWPSVIKEGGSLCQFHA